MISLTWPFLLVAVLGWASILISPLSLWFSLWGHAYIRIIVHPFILFY